MLDADLSRDPLAARLLQLSFQTSGDAIAMLAPDGEVLQLNARAMSALAPGRWASEVGSRWCDLWDAESHTGARSATTLAATGIEAECVATRTDADGLVRAWRSTIVPLVDADGAVSRLLATSRDVTAEREAMRALARTARVHEALVTATPEIVWHFDVASGTTDRRGWMAFTGKPDDAYDADGWLSFVHPDDHEAAKTATDQAMADARSLLISYRMRHHTGEWRWVEDHATPLLEPDGTVTDWVGIISDVHDRRTAEEALRSSEERLRLSVEATGLATWEIDAATGRQFWSSELVGMLGLPEDAAMTHETYLACVHPDDRRRVDHEFEMTVSSGRDVGTSVFRIITPGGEERWIEGHNRVFRDETQAILRHIGTLQDVTARKRAEYEVWLAAYQDPLTRAANRALFQLRLDDAIDAAVAAGGSVGVVMIDLDNFKDINDSLGHDAGDALLLATAERLTAACAPPATVARLGGDEFGIVLPITAGGAFPDHEVDAWLAALRRPIEHAGTRFRCTASIGWALCCADEGDPASLLKNADLALYAAKSAGRNAAFRFDPAMRVEATRRSNVLRIADDALSRDAVMPFYQPKVCLASGRVVGFEALLRWTDANGLRSPGEIREAFDDPDLAMRLGARMLERVVSDMRTWDDGGVPFGHVAINVGTPEFRTDESGEDLPTRLCRALSEARLPPSCLHVEITERVLLDNEADIVAPALARLQEAGIRIALDDFGTGYASLTHLQKYPVSQLKIDRSFVAQMQSSAGADAIVRALVGLARSLRITSVAEGAETAPQVAALKESGCDVVQGYAYGKPMAGTRVRHFLSTFDASRLDAPAHPGVAAATR